MIYGNGIFRKPQNFLTEFFYLLLNSKMNNLSSGIKKIKNNFLIINIYLDSSRRDLSKNVHILAPTCTIGPLCLKLRFPKNHVFQIFTLSIVFPR